MLWTPSAARARKRLERHLQVSAGHTLAEVGAAVLFLATAVFFILAVLLGGEWLGWAGLVALIGTACCVSAALYRPIVDPFPPSPEVVDLAVDLPQDAKSALERVLSIRKQEFWLASSARREWRRRALLVRAVHVLGDGAALVVDDAIEQGRDPLTVLLEAALEVHARRRPHGGAVPFSQLERRSSADRPYGTSAS